MEVHTSSIGFTRFTVHNSSDDVTAIRNRVVAHIQQPASNWIQCPHCYHGYVDGISDNDPHVHACAECLGLYRSYSKSGVIELVSHVEFDRPFSPQA